MSKDNQENPSDPSDPNKTQDGDNWKSFVNKINKSCSSEMDISHLELYSKSSDSSFLADVTTARVINNKDNTNMIAPASQLPEKIFSPSDIEKMLLPLYTEEKKSFEYKYPLNDATKSFLTLFSRALFATPGEIRPVYNPSDHSNVSLDHYLYEYGKILFNKNSKLSKVGELAIFDIARAAGAKLIIPSAEEIVKAALTHRVGGFLEYSNYDNFLKHTQKAKATASSKKKLFKVAHIPATVVTKSSGDFSLASLINSMADKAEDELNNIAFVVSPVVIDIPASYTQPYLKGRTFKILANTPVATQFKDESDNILCVVPSTALHPTPEGDEVSISFKIHKSRLDSQLRISQSKNIRAWLLEASGNEKAIYYFTEQTFKELQAHDNLLGFNIYSFVRCLNNTSYFGKEAIIASLEVSEKSSKPRKPSQMGTVTMFFELTKMKPGDPQEFPVENLGEPDSTIKNLFTDCFPMESQIIFEDNAELVQTNDDLEKMTRYYANAKIMRKVLDNLKISDISLEYSPNSSIADYLSKEIYSASSLLNLVSVAALHHPFDLNKAAVILSKKMNADDPASIYTPQNNYEEEVMANVIRPSSIEVTFDDIGGLTQIKSDIRNLISLPMIRPDLFTSGSLKRSPKGVLLFGPPGSGKTLIAKAVASSCGANFINISCADIFGKFVGDSENNVKAIFTVARALAPSIIFLDEADAILGRRKADEHETERKVKNEFMQQWDGLSSTGRVIVLASTNRPDELDEAILRRLPKKLFIDLPNEEQRVDILKVQLRGEKYENIDIEALAKDCKGFSGSDIAHLVHTTAHKPIREWAESVSKLGLNLTDNYDADGKLLPGLSEENGVVKPRKLTQEDFTEVLKNISASYSEDSIMANALREWNQKYGDNSTGKNGMPDNMMYI